MSGMLPRRPFLMRAIYEWIVESGCTPFVLVDSSMDEVVVPQQYAEGDRIVLNLSPSAVHALEIGSDAVCFNARFNGQSMQLSFPVDAVLALYARENGEGMVFSPMASDEAALDAARDEELMDSPGELFDGDVRGLSLVSDSGDSVTGDADDSGSDDPDDRPPAPKGGRPSLRVVK